MSLRKTLFPAWQSEQAVLNFNHISVKVKNQNKKLEVDNNTLSYVLSYAKEKIEKYKTNKNCLQ